MIATLFFSRLRADMSAELLSEYESEVAALERQARSFPGFVSIQPFENPEGERLTVVMFEDEEAQRRWASDPNHRRAQSRGRELYYERYEIVICREERRRSFVRADAAPVGAEMPADHR
jgi:heme-degrading monooxygenase HmoA